MSLCVRACVLPNHSHGSVLHHAHGCVVQRAAEEAEQAAMQDAEAEAADRRRQEAAERRRQEQEEDEARRSVWLLLYTVKKSSGFYDFLDEILQASV